MDYQQEERAKTRARLDELKKPKVIPREKPLADFSFKPATFDLPPSPQPIPSASKDSPLGFEKFIRRNQFNLRTKHSIFSSPPSFSSSSNPFLVENPYVVDDDVAATRTDAATATQTDVAAPQTDVKDDNVLADVTTNVVASIDPPSTASSDFFDHLPQPKLSSCIGE